MSFVGSKRFQRLEVRLNAWYALLWTVLFVLAILGARLAATRAINREYSLSLTEVVERHRLRIEGQGLSGLQRFVAEHRRDLGLRSFVRVSDDAGRTLVYDLPSADLEFDPTAIHPTDGSKTILSRGAEHGHPWQVLTTRVADRLWLQIGVDDQPRRALITTIERNLWILLFSGLVIGGLGGWWVTRRALAPVRQLAETCRQIVDSGDVDVRVPVPDTKDELGQLSTLFNRVLDRNRRLVEGMLQALDSVAHDLRTPLSRLRTGAELALQRDQDSPALREALADCIEESDRASSMLHTLMDISEAETGVMRLRLERLSWSQIVDETLDLYQYVAEQRGVHIVSECVEDRPFRGDHQRLARAVANLVDNALKYVEVGGKVAIKIERLGATGALTVEDDGVGIAPEHIDKIWLRLYRADASRARQGLGLGLSFVKAIVEAHGGTVRASSVLGKGSRFTIALPLADQPEASEA